MPSYFQFLKRQIYFKKCTKRDAKFESFRNKFLRFNDKFYKTYADLKSNPPDMDAFVYGSDQLWNPVIHSNTNVAVYFLDFVSDGKKRIAYSPSIGVQDVPTERQGERAEFIDKFDFLSVRENEALK